MLAMNIASKYFYLLLTCWFVYLCSTSEVRVPSNQMSVLSNTSNFNGRRHVLNSSQPMLQGHESALSLVESGNAAGEIPDVERAVELEEKAFVNNDRFSNKDEGDKKMSGKEKRDKDVRDEDSFVFNVIKADAIDKGERDRNLALEYEDVFLCKKCASNKHTNRNLHRDDVRFSKVVKYEKDKGRRMVPEVFIEELDTRTDRNQGAFNQHRAVQESMILLQKNNHVQNSRVYKRYKREEFPSHISGISNDAVANRDKLKASKKILNKDREEQMKPVRVTHEQKSVNSKQDSRIDVDNDENTIVTDELSYKAKSNQRKKDKIKNKTNTKAKNIASRENSHTSHSENTSQKSTRNKIELVDLMPSDDAHVDERETKSTRANLNQNEEMRRKNESTRKENGDTRRRMNDDSTNDATHSTNDKFIDNDNAKTTYISKQEQNALKRPRDQLPKGDWLIQNSDRLTNNVEESMQSDQPTQNIDITKINQEQTSENFDRSVQSDQPIKPSTKAKKSIGDSKQSSPNVLQDDQKNSAITADKTTSQGQMEGTSQAQTGSTSEGQNGTSEGQSSANGSQVARPVFRKNLTVGYLTAMRGAIKNKQGLLISGAMTLALHDVSTCYLFLVE